MTGNMLRKQDRPLEGILVLDFSQFLSAPSATLRLADLGARVIKVERPGNGDICRTLYISNMELDGDSTLFHSINRNKESFAADLRNPEHMEWVKALVRKADVLIQNFRPGVMERLGLAYEAVKKLNPGIVYGEITGYGREGPWADKPGQDLLAQSRTGLVWLNGEPEVKGGEPIPLGLSITDMIAGAHLVQGVLACLVRRGISGIGGHVEVSLLESTLDTEAVELTAMLNSEQALAGAFHPAPAGIYRTKDGWLALESGSVAKLGGLLQSPELAACTDTSDAFVCRYDIRSTLSALLATDTTAAWLAVLEAADYPCAEVLNWRQLLALEGFTSLDMVQSISRRNGVEMRTTCCPIRIDGERYTSPKASPKVGEDTGTILQEFGLTHC